MPGLLYAITPAGWPTPRLLNACAQALDAGADWLQYRDKPAPRRDVATALATLCAKRGVPLLINDDPPLAASLGVGVHVGRDDTAVAAVIGAGADGVACIDAIFGQDDVAAAVRSLRAAIDSACQPART